MADLATRRHLKAVAQLLETVDHETLRAIAAAGMHSTQLAILAELHQSEDSLSPKELANRLDIGSLPAIAYHVRELEQKQLITLVATAPRRGATEHFYRLAAS